MLHLIYIFDFLKHEYLLQGILGPQGLMNTAIDRREAAIYSLDTLMTIAPTEVYTEFVKVYILDVFIPDFLA